MPNKPQAKRVSADLARKARLILDSTLFVNPSPGAELADKQMIFLALAGLKPMSGALSGHWAVTQDGRRMVADGLEEVQSFLSQLGLASSVEDDGYAAKAVVSLSPDLVQEYRHGVDMRRAGEMFGYPKTAVAAFVGGTSLNTDAQEQIEKRTGLPPTVCVFRFSKDHWREELVVVEQWRDMLATYGMIGI